MEVRQADQYWARHWARRRVGFPSKILEKSRRKAGTRDGTPRAVLSETMLSQYRKQCWSPSNMARASLAPRAGVDQIMVVKVAGDDFGLDPG